jgi:hypothetical protein
VAEFGGMEKRFVVTIENVNTRVADAIILLFFCFHGFVHILNTRTITSKSFVPSTPIFLYVVENSSSNWCQLQVE